MSELITYPIKGCGPTPLDDAELTVAGLEHDRTFMVIHESGLFLSQRRDPRLAVVRPSVTGGGARLRLSAPGLEPVGVDVRRSGPTRPVTLFKQEFTGIDQGDDAAAWFSTHLDAPVRLVRVPPDHQRVSTGVIPGTSGYADSCAVLLTSTTSLDDLNRRICASGREPVPMSRFRPNFVVTGLPEPHAEDELFRLRIGGAELGFAKVAIRCAVTLVDQPTGRKAGPEPLRTLATYRRRWVEGESGVAFGTKYVVLQPGRVAAGDAVRIS